MTRVEEAYAQSSVRSLLGGLHLDLFDSDCNILLQDICPRLGKGFVVLLLSPSQTRPNLYTRKYFIWFQEPMRFAAACGQSRGLNNGPLCVAHSSL